MQANECSDATIKNAPNCSHVLLVVCHTRIRSNKKVTRKHPVGFCSGANVLVSDLANLLVGREFREIVPQQFFCGAVVVVVVVVAVVVVVVFGGGMFL